MNAWLDYILDTLNAPLSVWTQAFMVGGATSFFVHLAGGGTPEGFHAHTGVAWGLTGLLTVVGVMVHEADEGLWKDLFHFRFIRRLADLLFAR